MMGRGQPQMKPAQLNRLELLLLVLSIFVAFTYFLGVPKNPPGFFIDEASIAYNAHRIALQGIDEHGQSFPLYFRAFGEFKSPVYIYVLAAVFRVTGPSILAARMLSAIFGLTAAVLLGLLAFRISHRRIIGFIIFIGAALTPWLFEVSRLVFEVTLLPALLALFLLCLHRASKQEKWSWRIAVVLGVLLGLMVYSYSAARLLAPLFALGLIFFVTRQRWRGVVLTWFIFALTLMPLAYFSVRHPGALGERFKYVTYVKPADSRSDIVFHFLKNYARDFSPRIWLIKGDPEPRHHLPGMGSLLAGVAILGALGFAVVLLRYRREAWWRFVLYGLLVSPIPASLTLDHFHTLRLIGLPVFLLVLTVPAIEFLYGKSLESSHDLSEPPASAGGNVTMETGGKNMSRQSFRRPLLAALVALTIVQGVIFQWQFHNAPPRVDAFDSYYPQVLDAALAQSERPIYLFDKTPAAYMYAFWYATLRGLNLNTFQRANLDAPPPPGAVVISHELPCTNCEMIFERGQFRVYKNSEQ
jgi:4-amino-4-deoxy-L-arabinose transferase-like glycosyltransferase